MLACVKCRIQINQTKKQRLWNGKDRCCLLLLQLYWDSCYYLSSHTYIHTFMCCLPFFQAKLDEYVYSKCLCRFSLWWRIQQYGTTKGFLHIFHFKTLEEHTIHIRVCNFWRLSVIAIQCIYARKMIIHFFYGISHELNLLFVSYVQNDRSYWFIMQHFSVVFTFF